MAQMKHLTKGSSKPQLPEDGQLRLYAMRFCPYAQRIHLVLDAKNIPYHTIYINLADKPEWLQEISPLERIPVLEIPSKGSLYESLIVADFLDEQYPERKLYSSDPFEKAQQKILVERFGSVNSAYARIVFSPDGKIPPGALTEFGNAMDVYESELKKSGKSYFGGDRPNIVDYMIWPWCERVRCLEINLKDRFELDQDRFGYLLKWKALMENDEAVKKTILPAEAHIKYLESRFCGENDHDFLF